MVTNLYSVYCMCITDSAWKFVHSLEHRFFHSPLSLICRQIRICLPFIQGELLILALIGNRCRYKNLLLLYRTDLKNTDLPTQQHKNKQTKKKKNPTFSFSKKLLCMQGRSPAGRDSLGGISWPCYWKNFPAPTFGKLMVQSLREMLSLSDLFYW